MTNKIILGTVQLGIPYGINNSTGKPDVKEAHKILSLAKQNGIEILDTAKAYGTSMEVIGDYHRGSENKFKVISKFHAKENNLAKDISDELQLLNIKQFEAYLFHSFADFENSDLKIRKVLENLKNQGLIKKIGVSVYGNDQFEKAIHDEVDIIQLPFNLLDNMNQRGKLMELAKSKGKELHVRSVFLQGLFFKDLKTIPEKLKPITHYLEEVHKIVESERLTMQQVALGYALKNPLIDKVLIGVDSEEHLRVNLDNIEKIEVITKKLMDRIDTIDVKENKLLNPVNWN